MVKIDDNPFERWGLDPAGDERELTEAMRRKSRQLPPDQRQKLQEDWRKLTGDPVERARWILLTPPLGGGGSTDIWELAEEIVKTDRPPELPALRPTLEDGLVLPVMGEDSLRDEPPFLPEILRKQRRRSDDS